MQIYQRRKQDIFFLQGGRLLSEKVVHKQKGELRKETREYAENEYINSNM